MQHRLILAGLALALTMACTLTEGLATPPPVPSPTLSPPQSKTLAILPAPTAAATATDTPQLCTVATGIEAGALNFRSGPGIAYAVIDTLTEGEQLTILSGPAAWIEVQRGDVTGWINASYCTTRTP